MQRRTMLKSEIRDARTTESDCHLPSSVTIDVELMEAADIREYEQVTIVNADTGAHLETYALAGERGGGEVRLNGASARMVASGTLVTLLSYETLMTIELDIRQPRIVHLDQDNRLVTVDGNERERAIR
ncbi:MAG TPA: aspartate 1-decarboxylase [Solirubrobacteraceae bacterium]|nr:aspartate 1-decarboxylase [Solirubrobacteraceae bacterium]